ncbi:hypothetical protein AB833_11845 [Chromatiales bacterium (ex Bugula neritina AB1)]|nr:hypothetical protein AB833_11845 [Chromatiales bacterium (ex Bugula neritina AB1)]
MTDVEFDWQRESRTGIGEAVLCQGKSVEQLKSILSVAQDRSASLLLTRIKPDAAEQLIALGHSNLCWHRTSSTAVLDNGLPELVDSPCLIVTAGTSDMPVAEEASVTLRYYGLKVEILADCGVAGLWRITDKLEKLRRAPVIIAIAGMEGALFSVLAGLVPGLIIAVPASTGYGVGEYGKAALSSALTTCAPGVVTVNIDNGFGAACAMLKLLRHSHYAHNQQ